MYREMTENELFRNMKMVGGVTLDLAYAELRRRGFSQEAIVWHTFPRVISDTRWDELETGKDYWQDVEDGKVW